MCINFLNDSNKIVLDINKIYNVAIGNEIIVNKKSCGHHGIGCTKHVMGGNLCICCGSQSLEEYCVCC